MKGRSVSNRAKPVYIRKGIDMGRRKKEPRNVHREAIASAAQGLFMEKGIEAATMDEIAREAGYSKATLYVYFKNKEEIVGILVLESMQKLHDYLSAALEEQDSTRTRYDLICGSLLRYQEEFPFYFKTALEEINIDFDNDKAVPEDRETFRIGEEINKKVARFLMDGIAAGELREDLKIMPAIFSIWGMMSGLIQVASNKAAYIGQEMKLSKKEFLSYGFDTLYRSIASGEDRG